MLGGPRPRVFSFVSTQKGADKAAMLINLCASLSAAGSDVMLLEACAGECVVAERLGSARATLSDAALGAASLDDVVVQASQGFRFAALLGSVALSNNPQPKADRLDAAFRELVGQTGIVVIDTGVADDGKFALTAMQGGDIVIQVTPDPASITEAYAAIKRLNAHFGRRPFGVLVTGATEAEAARIFDNMAKAASRYLAVSLDFIGSVPADDHLKRAAGLGRPVTDAFPLAGASVAFRRLAQRFALSECAREATQGN